MCVCVCVCGGRGVCVCVCKLWRGKGVCVALGLEQANYLLHILEPQTAVLTGCLQISLIGKLDLMRESNLPQSQ